jgi:hypothetical protein
MPQIFKALALMVAAAKLAMGDPNFKVLDVMFGSDAELDATGVHMIENPRQWQEFWTSVEGDAVMSVGGGSNRPNSTIRDLPRIDFEKNIVLGVFGGALPNVAGYQVIGADGMGEKAFVRIRPVFRNGNAEILIHNPYLLVLLPRTKKEIEVQMLVPSRSNKPVFRTLQTLPRTLKEEKKVDPNKVKRG